MHSARTITLAVILFELFSWTLSQNRVCSITRKPSSYLHETSYKYQSTLEDVQGARTITLAFILFELFPLDFCPSQNRISSITWKLCKISSWNFIWISVNIRPHAKRKNHNSCIYTFWVIALGISFLNINVRWMCNTIWHQKGRRHLCFCRKTKSGFWMIILVTINGFSPNLVCALIFWTSALGLLLGQFCPFLTELSASNTSVFYL